MVRSGNHNAINVFARDQLPEIVVRVTPFVGPGLDLVAIVCFDSLLGALSACCVHVTNSKHPSLVAAHEPLKKATVLRPHAYETQRDFLAGGIFGSSHPRYEDE